MFTCTAGSKSAGISNVLSRLSRMATNWSSLLPVRCTFFARCSATVAEQRAKNVHLAGKSEDAFVAMREDRDKHLDMPALLLPAVQVNIRAGALPAPEANGVSYLKIPVNRF